MSGAILRVARSIKVVNCGKPSHSSRLFSWEETKFLWLVFWRSHCHFQRKGSASSPIRSCCVTPKPVVWEVYSTVEEHASMSEPDEAVG